jgi:hypothetical protein
MFSIKNFFDGSFLLALIFLFFATQADAQENWLCDESGCAAAISPTEYSGRAAWKLTDGKTEAIVVPSLGRMMSFKRVGGENWLWENSAAAKISGDNWKNWGGDKTWLAPQKRWKELGSKTGWPPPREWDGAPFQSQILSGGKLKIWGPVSPTTGLRISRIFYHDENGDFVIEQTVSKVSGAPMEASIWDVAQITGANLNAVFLSRAEKSNYENGFRWLQGKAGAEITCAPRIVSPNLLKVAPVSVTYKIGTDAPIAAIAAMRDDWALVLKTGRSDGIYPDGETPNSGLSVEFFNSGDAKNNYVELELLSPLLLFKSGERHTQAVRWSVHALPSVDASDVAVHAAIEKLLG